MSRRIAWPAHLEQDAQGIAISFPDFPNAFSDAVDDDDAAEQAFDCILEALAWRISRREPLPSASRPGKNDILIELPPLEAAKVALYGAMVEKGVSTVALAKRLRCDPSVVRRLIDLNHTSKIGAIDEALRLLDRRLRVIIDDAA